MVYDTFTVSSPIVNVRLFVINAKGYGRLSVFTLLLSTRIDMYIPQMSYGSVCRFNLPIIDNLTHSELVGQSCNQTLNQIQLNYLWLCTFSSRKIKLIELTFYITFVNGNYSVLKVTNIKNLSPLINVTNMLSGGQYVFCPKLGEQYDYFIVYKFHKHI